MMFISLNILCLTACTGPKPLPIVGSFLNYKGAQGHPGYNFAHNVFAPEKRAVWGDTVLALLPNSAGPKGEVLKVTIE
jgi:hypothetical protein